MIADMLFEVTFISKFLVCVASRNDNKKPFKIGYSGMVF